MSKSLFRQVVVPVANREDAASTAEALTPYIDDVDGTAVAVHVVEKRKGGLDKASVEHREREAREIFAVVTEELADTDASLVTEIRYGTNVAAAIVETAHDVDASAIVFTPRGGSRWKKVLSGDVTHRLVAESDVPILSLPDLEDVDE